MPIGNIKSVKRDVEMIKVELGRENIVESSLYYIENWVNLEVYVFGSGCVTLVFPFNNKRFEFMYRKDGRDKYIFENKYIGRMCVIYFEGIKKFTFNENKFKIDIFEIDKYFIKEGFQKFYLSQDLIHMRSKIKLAYGLDHYYDNDEPLLIFGLYNDMDLSILRGVSGKVGILWGGSDIMLDRKSRFEAIDIVKKIGCVNYAMSKIVYDKLIELGIENVKKVVVSFCWNDIRYRIRDFSYLKRRTIYIYDGMDKGKKKKIIYNQDLVDKIVPVLSKEFKIIRSSDGFCDDVLSLYKNSFVSLRLTAYDGNANSAQECGMIGIPVISNQEMNHCISWNSGEEIIYKCRYIYERAIKIYWRKNGVNVLFISNDMPGKGGGATFTGNLVDYLKNRGFNLYEIYLVHCDKECGIEYSDRRFIVRFNQKRKWDLGCWMDKMVEKEMEFGMFLKEGCKVVLRSSVGDLRKIKDKYEVIFMSPGIYKNDMGSEFDMKFINSSNIKTATALDSYANSSLTQSVFHKLGLNEVKLLEINFLQIRDIFVGGERDIDCLFVVSNIERKIKNSKLFFELAKVMKKKFVLISAEKIKQNIPKIEKIIDPDNLDDYYRRAKCLINCSYFDSMSNVVLEAINNGCHVIVSENNGIADYIDKDLRDKFVVDGYELKDWENRLVLILKDWDKFEKERRILWEDLRRKSWEVEIKLLEQLTIS